MNINIELIELHDCRGKVERVYPKVNCHIDLDENYSTDYLRKFIPQLRDLLDEQLNNALKFNNTNGGNEI